MGTRFVIEEVPQSGGERNDEKVGRLTHGGFRQNAQHQWIESAADEEGMARDVLRQTGSGYPDGMLTEGHDRMMGAWGANGSKSDYHTSKWAKK